MRLSEGILFQKTANALTLKWENNVPDIVEEQYGV